MMKHTTSPRTLLIVWAILMALSIATMIAGKVTDVQSPGLLWMAILLLVAGSKAILILRYYLDLKSASEGWSKAFISLVSLLLLTLFALYAIG